MKKSELKQIIRQLVKEQMDIDLPPMLKDKGRSGPFNPFGMPGMENNLNKALGRPRSLRALQKNMMSKRVPAGIVNSVIAAIMRDQQIDMDDDIQGIWPVVVGVLKSRAGQAIIYSILGYALSENKK
tara:strand:- start:94 stop:474 length:381 start_codon:yes stop_codon:yes gene_type:complete